MQTDVLGSPGPHLKRVKRHLANSSKLDFAPTKNHIKFKNEGLNYYMPNLFHLSKTLNYDGYLPISVKDVLKLKSFKSLYQYDGYDHNAQTISMYSNHPVRQISIMGRVMGEQVRYSNSNQTTHFLEICDGSSGNTITVKVDRQMYLMCQLAFEKNFDKLLRVRGVPYFYFKENVEIHAHQVQVMGKTSDLGLEMDWWTQMLEVRSQYLIQPWVLNESDLMTTEEAIENTTPKVHRNNLADTINNRNNKLSPVKPATAFKFADVDSSQITLEESVAYFEKLYNLRPIEVIDSMRCEIEFLKFFVKANKSKVPFEEAYSDPGISGVLTSIVLGNLMNEAVGVNDEELAEKLQSCNIVKAKRKMFHSIRKQLCEAKLMIFTKSFNIEPTNLLVVFRFLVSEVKSVMARKESQVRGLATGAEMQVRDGRIRLQDALNIGLSKLEKCELNPVDLASQISAKFQAQVKIQYINSMISMILTGDHVALKGFKRRVMKLDGQCKIRINWFYSVDESRWVYGTELVFRSLRSSAGITVVDENSCGVLAPFGNRKLVS